MIGHGDSLFQRSGHGLECHAGRSIYPRAIAGGALRHYRQHRRPAQRSQRRLLSGLRGLLDPQYALPIAAQLIGGATPEASFAGALGAAGQAIPDMRQRAAMNAYLKSQSGLNLTPEEQQLLQSDPELGRAFVARQLTPKPPISVGFGERLLDPNTLKPIDLGDAGGGTYSPTSTEGADSNAILRGQRDPAFRATPEYQLAYSRISKPQMVQSVVNGNTITTPIYPDLGGILPPTGVGSAVPAAAGGAASDGSPDAAASDAAPAVAGGPGVRVGKPIITGQKQLTEQVIRNKELLHVNQREAPVLKQNFDELASLGNQALALGGPLTTWMTSPGYQRGRSAIKSFVANYLYSTSGATANPGEVETISSTLTPFPGESKASLDDKKARADTMLEAMQIAASGGQVSEALKAKAEGRAPGNAASDIKEGDTATGPGGHKIVMKNGQWVDAQTGQPIQ